MVRVNGGCSIHSHDTISARSFQLVRFAEANGKLYLSLLLWSILESDNLMVTMAKGVAPYMAHAAHFDHSEAFGLPVVMALSMRTKNFQQVFRDFFYFSLRANLRLWPSSLLVSAFSAFQLLYLGYEKQESRMSPRIQNALAVGDPIRNANFGSRTER